ncbi:MAG: GNAT family N-acetyltransferase [Cyclobacteriaceae bacterium]|nr:GNAT family N-acetyltransferase [Cyclobacteriaceae bacterium]
MSEELEIRMAQLSDSTDIYQLYQRVADDPQGIIRAKSEITTEYVQNFISNSMNTGLILVLTLNHQIIGEIHAYRYGIEALDHNLGDLTIVIHPRYQGKGYGKKLFEAFLNRIEQLFPDILRVELITREQNLKTRAFYSSLGFKEEGRMSNRIRNAEGHMETPLQMAWMNPDYRGN